MTLKSLTDIPEHECDDKGDIFEYDFCSECKDHSSFCSVCGTSSCCGAGQIRAE